MHTDKWLERPVSRRAFGTGAITAGAGAAGAILVGGALGNSVDTLFSPTSANAAAAITDTDILNFAHVARPPQSTPLNLSGDDVHLRYR